MHRSMGKWTTYLMKVYLGKLCVSSNLTECKSAIHVICLSFLETCTRPPVMPDHAFTDNKISEKLIIICINQFLMTLFENRPTIV